MSPALLAGAQMEAQQPKAAKSGKVAAAENAQFEALIPMAPRLDSVHGKTIYLVDTGFMSGGVLLQQMQIWFNKNYPDVTVVFRKKAGSYMEDDPPLWKEIKEKGNAAIMAIGH